MRPLRLALALTLAAPTALAPHAAHAQAEVVTEAQARADAAPRDHAARRALGMALLRAGRWADARRALEQALRLAPRGSVDAAYDVARVAFAAGDHAAAERACRAVARPSRTAVLARVCNARADLVWNRSARAFEALEAALATEPGNVEALLARGDAYRLRGSVAEAEADYRRAAAGAPSAAEPHLGLGRLYAAARRRDDAVRALRRALELDGTSPEILFELGRALGPTSEAAALLARATAGRPGWAEAEAARGEALLGAGDAATSEEAFRAAIRANEELAPAHAGLGRARVARGDFAGAEVPLRTALELVSNDAATTLALADVLAHTDRAEEAYETYRRASDLDPSNPEGLLRAARLALERGRDVLASGFLDRVLGRTADLAAALALYGDVMHARRDDAAARDYYTRALAGSGALDRARVEAARAALPAR